MYNKICHNCGKKNKSTNIKCEFCGYDLVNIDDSEKKIRKYSSKYSQSNINLVKILLFIYWGLIFPFAAFGLICLISGVDAIKENVQYRNYLTVNSKLVGYRNCYDDGDYLECNGIYEYKVDGVTYRYITPDVHTKDSLNDYYKLMYNPSNPKDVFMKFDQNEFLLLFGIVIYTVLIVVFIIICRIALSIKNHIKKK